MMSPSASNARSATCRGSVKSAPTSNRERPIAADPTATRCDRRTVEMIETIIRDQTGKKARDVRLLPTEAGSVLFTTVPVGANASLADAHRVASELEETVRQRLPEIADGVVHTEP